MKKLNFTPQRHYVPRPDSRIQFYATSSELEVPPASTDEILKAIPSYSALDTISLLSRANVALGISGVHSRELNVSLAIELLGPALAQRLSLTNNYQKNAFPWLTPYHFRLAISLLLRYGNRNGGQKLADEHARQQFGNLLLAMPESIKPEIRGRSKLPWAHLKSQLTLQHTVYRPLEHFKTLEVKEYCLRRLLDDEDFESVIKTETGVSVQELYSALIVIWARFSMHTHRLASESSTVSISLPYLLGMCGLDFRVGNYIIENFTLDLRPGSSADTWEEEANYSIKKIVDRPLGRVADDQLVCFDIELLLQRLARSIFNLTNKVATKNKKVAINSKLGAYYEEFCRSLLQRILTERRGSGDYLFDRVNLKEHPVDDLYVIGETAIAFEYKSGYLPISASFGTDSDLLEHEINSRYVYGSEKGKKGFAQLKQHIGSIIRKRHSLGLAHVKEYIPCVVVEDELMTSTAAWTHAIFSARKMFNDLSIFVRHPIIIHHDELHVLAKLSREWRPDTVLRRVAGYLRLEDISVQTGMLRMFSIEEAERRHGVVELDRNLPLLEQAVGMLKDDFYPSVTLECDCGEEMIIVPGLAEDFKWWCSKCEKISDEPVAAEVIVEQNNNFNIAVKRYWGASI